MSEEKGFLTDTDREYLRGQKEYNSKQGRYARRQSIRERTRGALTDFRLLANVLSSEEREKIFSAEPRSEELRELNDDVAGTVEFLYAGMGGESGFRQPLQNGVLNGELALGNITNPFDVTPRFSVNRAYQPDRREIADLIEAEEWERLNPKDLATFIRFALQADAIDFDAVRQNLNWKDWADEHVGKKRRTIPGGKQTPLMDPEIFEREGIGEMSGDELREMFGEGYSGACIYDGEKVFTVPFDPDEEPEILDRIGDPPDGASEES